MFEKTLQSAGLTAGEAEVYEILLNLGPSPAQAILKKTALKRGNVYNILDSLAAKGLVLKKEDTGAKTVFAPSSPTALFDLVAGQEEAARQGKRALEDTLEHLRSRYALHQEKPIVRFFEGLEGIRTVIFDSLSAKGPIDTYMDPEALEKYAKKINEEYIAKRAALKIPKKIIALDTPFARAHYKEMASPLTEVRLIPAKFNPFKTGLQIYNNVISYTTLTDKKMIGVIIEDAGIADMHRSIFEYVWSTLSALRAGEMPSPKPLPTGQAGSLAGRKDEGPTPRVAFAEQ